MFIKFFKNRILLYGISFITIWILGNIIFFTCSLTDKCIFKKPNTRLTESTYLPIESCHKKFKAGSSFIKTSNNYDIMVIAPDNHYAERKYPLLKELSK